MEFKKWFVAERAKALAIVLLTRRNDLVVKETKEENGLDLTVHLGAANDLRERRFGVLLRATMTPITIEQANKQLKPTMASIRSLGAFAYPVCVFYFIAKDGQGYFTWACEPVINTKGQPKLKYHGESHCEKLNDQSLGEILITGNKWYDAFYTMLTA